MRYMKTFLAGLAVLTAVGTGLAQAADTAPAPVWMGGRMDQSLYLGVNAGYAKAANIGTTLPAGMWFDSTAKDDDNFAYKIYAGFPVYPNFAIEVGYHKLGRFSFSGTTQPAGILSQNWRVTGWAADLVAKIPVWQRNQERLSIFSRIGGFYNSTDPVASSAGAIAVQPTTDESGWDLKTGLGVEYDWSRSTGMRVEWERYRELGPTKLNLDLYSAGLYYRFD